MANPEQRLIDRLMLDSWETDGFETWGSCLEQKFANLYKGLVC